MFCYCTYRYTFPIRHDIKILLTDKNKDRVREKNWQAVALVGFIIASSRIYI